MPNKPTAKRGFPCKPEDCYASRHLEPNLFKMYDLMRAFAKAGQKSRGHKQLVCTASVRPTLCNAYPCAESTAHKLIEELCDRGWLITRAGDRDPRTGHLSPNTYDLIEHDEFVKSHRGSCPPYLFAQDFETAEAYGLRRGDRLSTGDMPENFLNVLDYLSPERRAMWLALGEYYGRMSDDERVLEYERLRNLKGAPEDPKEYERRTKENAEVRRLIGNTPLRDLGAPLSEDGEHPSPRPRSHGLRGFGENPRRFNPKEFRLR